MKKTIISFIQLIGITIGACGIIYSTYQSIQLKKKLDKLSDSIDNIELDTAEVADAFRDSYEEAIRYLDAEDEE